MASSLAENIKGHLRAYDEVLEALVALHGRIVEGGAFDVRRNDRDFAIWAMGGRCLSLGRALLALLRAGFCAEVVPIARSLHEAEQLLDVFTSAAFLQMTEHHTGVRNESQVARGEAKGSPTVEDLLKRWLEDKTWIRPQQARHAIDRAAYALKHLSGDPRFSGWDSTRAPRAIIYDILSQGGHNRRRGVAEQVSLDRGQFAYGPHPEPKVLAVHVYWAGLLVDAVVISFRSLAVLCSLEKEDDECVKLLEVTAAIRETFPLPRLVRPPMDWAPHWGGEPRNLTTR